MSILVLLPTELFMERECRTGISRIAGVGYHRQSISYQQLLH